jgi:transposase-like protein
MLDLREQVLSMPWQEVNRVSLRKEFMLMALQAGSNRRELCRRFGIAPKTGYKWLLRYAQAGASWRVCSRARTAAPAWRA